MEGENLPRVVCSCGADILHKNIEFDNKENEEGEEYGVVTATCGFCLEAHETFQWGWFDGDFDACKYLIAYLKNLHETD